MSPSIIIRHSKTPKPWNTLPYEELVALLHQKDDPSIDKDFLKALLDPKKVQNLGVKKIVCSPVRRAQETAEFCAEILGLPIEVEESLRELIIELPKEVYDKGTPAVREYLVRKTETMEREVNLPQEALIVTHGFLMRIIYLKLFGGSFENFISDPRFTEYLQGFNVETGELASLQNIGVNKS